MRDEEDRLGRLAGEPEQIEVELLAGEQIDGSERLVHQHERRIVDQRAADGCALAHADRQLIGVRALEPGQADQPQKRARPVDELRPVQPLDLDGQEDVVEHRPPLEQDVSLEDHSDAVRGTVHLAAVHHDLPGARAVQSRGEHQQRALAAAARPDDAAELRLGDRAADAIEGEQPAAVPQLIGHGDGAHLHQRRAPSGLGTALNQLHAAAPGSKDIAFRLSGRGSTSTSINSIK